MYYPFGYDPTMLLIIPAFIFALWAQWRVSAAYKEYAQVKQTAVGSARDLARQLLDAGGARDVEVREIPGEMTDNYDPINKVLNLSSGVYGSNSVAALGIAAHEVGHALQHKTAYQPLMFRNHFFPVANIGSTLAIPMFFVGILFSMPFLMDLGILAFTLAVAFHAVTLPVEFDASGRALQLLEKGQYLDAKGLYGAKKVLSAAALTYIAAAAMAVLQLLRLLVLRGQRDD